MPSELKYSLHSILYTTLLKSVDRTDPICGMKGTIKAHGHYFCSEHCIRKYEEEHNIPENKVYCPSCEVKNVWYKEEVIIAILATAAIVLFSYVFPALNPFFDAFVDYFSMIWWAIFVGFFVGGVIDYFIPRSYIKKYLSKHRKKTILYSVIFGFVMSACSHGILAVAIELYRKGASTPSVIAFLLASPWANLPITFILFGFFGLNAFFIVLSAILIAITTGIVYQYLEKKGMVECHEHSEDEEEDFSVKEDIIKRWKNYNFTFKNIKDATTGIIRGSWSLSKMVLWWLLIGMIMASAARAFVPHNLFVEYMGATFFGLIITLAFATIIEVCSEGSSPLAFEIFNQTGAFGNSFTFLMAGVATDYTELGLIWSNIGKKAALFLPIITVPQILILGYVFNVFL